MGGNILLEKVKPGDDDACTLTTLTSLEKVKHFPPLEPVLPECGSLPEPSEVHYYSLLITLQRMTA